MKAGESDNAGYNKTSQLGYIYKLHCKHTVAYHIHDD